MQALNYNNLNSKSNSVSPYRGTLNRFPIGNRRENKKYFLVGEENGERVFTIVYGSRFKFVSLTKEEHDEQKKNGVDNLYENEHTGGTWDYRRYDRIPNILGLVRPDNTFEFTSIGDGQSERSILSNYSFGKFSTDSRRGGTIWKSGGYHGYCIMPIYEGLRVHCETMRPTKPITVIGRKVDRKAGKGLLAKYKDFYATTEVMTKAMNYEMFISTANDVVNEHLGEIPCRKSYTDYLAKAEALLHTAPLDAAMLYMLMWDISSMRWNLRKFNDSGVSRYSASEDTPYTTFLNLKRKLNKEVYKANDGAFKKVEYVNGKMYPTSEWDYTVMVDGVEVKQYD